MIVECDPCRGTGTHQQSGDDCKRCKGWGRLKVAVEGPADAGGTLQVEDLGTVHARKMEEWSALETEALANAKALLPAGSVAAPASDWDYDDGAHTPTVRDGEPPPLSPLLRMGMSHVIDQGNWWLPKDGPPLWLPTMSHRYKRNVHAFLLRRAVKIEFSWSLMNLSMGATLGGDMAIDAFESVMDEHNDKVGKVGAEQWLRERPLLRELTYQTEAAAYDGPVQ